MRDNRSFWQKLLKRNPNWYEMTAKGRHINFGLRIVYSVVIYAMFLFSYSVFPASFLIFLGIYLVALVFGVYWIDRYTCSKFTFAAEREDIAIKAKNVIPKEEK